MNRNRRFYDSDFYADNFFQYFFKGGFKQIRSKSFREKIWIRFQSERNFLEFVTDSLD